jgi:hypothetical protein
MFFVSLDKKNFCSINKFMEVEEIFPSMLDISSTLNSLQFKSKLKLNKPFWGIINNYGKGEIFSDQIRLSKGVTIYSKKIKLFDVFSSDIFVKIILELNL